VRVTSKAGEGTSNRVKLVAQRGKPQIDSTETPTPSLGAPSPPQNRREMERISLIVVQPPPAVLGLSGTLLHQSKYVEESSVSDLLQSSTQPRAAVPHIKSSKSRGSQKGPHFRGPFQKPMQRAHKYCLEIGLSTVGGTGSDSTFSSGISGSGRSRAILST
jgi:hypothetical protein